MSLNTPYQPGDTIESSKHNQDLDGLATGDNDVDSNSLKLFRSESFADFVADGCIWNKSSGLNASMSAGVVYIGGERVPVSAVGNYAFPGNGDTYVDVNDAAQLNYQTVTQGNDAPAIAESSVRIGLVTTADNSITSIRQNGYDNKGSKIYNQSPNDTGKTHDLPRFMVRVPSEYWQHFASNTHRRANFGNITYDTHDGFNLSNNRYVAPESGLWLIGCSAGIRFIGNGILWQFHVRVNGSPTTSVTGGGPYIGNAENTGGGNSHTSSAAGIVEISKGDIIELFMMANLGSSGAERRVSTATRLWGVKLV